jgi:hypothetical protein
VSHFSAITEDVDAASDALGAVAARTLCRAHLLRGDLPAALAVAQQVAAAQGGRADPVDLVIEDALGLGQIGTARGVLALVAPLITAPHGAQIKARIALGEEDFAAAKAILVMAIEQSPDHPGLRALLAEVMVAAGSAAEVRAVLTHIAKPPVNPISATAPAPGTAPCEGETGRAS